METTHRALLYRSADEFAALTAREVHGALAAGRPVLAALPAAHLDLLQAELDREAEQVRWVDMSTEGRNPGRILPVVLTAFEHEHPGTPVTMVGEPIWPGRSSGEYAAAVAHEALINLAFAGRPVDVLCPYDVTGLSPEAVLDAGRTHPELVDRRGSRASEDYADPTVVAAEASAQLAPVPADSLVLQLDRLEELGAARRQVQSLGRLAGLSTERADRFTLACHEAMANALRHGGGHADVRLWRERDDSGGDGRDDIVAQVRSSAGFTNLLAGRRLPAPDADRGRGLVLVNEICDLVQLSATPQGATIQLRMSCLPAGPD